MLSVYIRVEDSQPVCVRTARCFVKEHQSRKTTGKEQPNGIEWKNTAVKS